MNLNDDLDRAREEGRQWMVNELKHFPDKWGASWKRFRAMIDRSRTPLFDTYEEYHAFLEGCEECYKEYIA